MRRFSKTMVPIFIIILFLFLVGCNSNKNNNVNQVKQTNDSVNVKTPESTQNPVTVQVDPLPKETPMEPEIEVTPGNIVPNTGATDSKHLSWWIRRIPGAAAGIDPNFQNLCKRYNGIYIGNTTKKQVALTFDVGDAGNENVPALLNMLRKHNVLANFFVTGQWVQKNPQVFKAIVADGHLIGNHSYSHPDLTTLSLDQLADQIKKTDNIIIANGGPKPVFFRPPFGYFSENVLNKIYTMGYYTTFWGISMTDWLPMTQEQLIHGVTDYAHNGAVALLHVTPDGVRALDTTIPELKSRGYQFVTLAQMIG